MDIFFESILIILAVPLILGIVLVGSSLILSVPLLGSDYLTKRILINKFLKKYSFEKNTIFVYSHNFKWDDYLENQLFPQIADSTIFYDINSEKTKNRTIEKSLFEHFKPSKEYSPMAIVLTEKKKVKIFHFYLPLVKNYRGNGAKLQKLETEFLSISKFKS